MKKQILNIGKSLNKAEQKSIAGGNFGFGEVCTRPSGNSCDPSAGQFHGNPACNINEVCVGLNAVIGTCQCPD